MKVYERIGNISWSNKKSGTYVIQREKVTYINLSEANQQFSYNRYCNSQFLFCETMSNFQNIISLFRKAKKPITEETFIRRNFRYA